MDLGLFIFPTAYSIGVVELARAAEEHGFESLWVPEHTHIPTSRRTPWPGGAELPRHYLETLDPFGALCAMAAVTSRIKLGTAVCLVIERDPITLAKQVATLDLVSNGRFLFGIGGGWNREEMENHGTNPKTRFRLLREQVLAMQAIWTQDTAEYHGQFVQFDPIWSWPKPVQRPYPPVLMGGNGPGTLQRVVEYCDEWFPIAGLRKPEERIPELQRLASEAGRGPIPVSLSVVPPDADTLERYQQLGVSRCTLALPSAPASEVLPMVERYAELARRFG